MSRTTVMQAYRGGAERPREAIQCDLCGKVQRFLASAGLPRGWGVMADGRHFCVACKMSRKHDPLSARPALVQCACGVKTTERDRAGHVARCEAAQRSA